MDVFSGTVKEASECLADPDFLAQCAERFADWQGRRPDDAELRSWERSWPALLHALSAAELHGLHLLLEYELPGSSQRVDALLLGRESSHEALVAVAIELKQWSEAQAHTRTAGKLLVGDREVIHPARQVGGYVRYLHDWVPAEQGLEVRGLAYLHNASRDLIERLREHVRGGPSDGFALLGSEDVPREARPQDLADRLQCRDLQPPDPERIDSFLQVRHRPSPSLLSKVAEHISVSGDFRLIGEQDSARQEIHRATGAARSGSPGHIVVVTGGPGTGKTAIACRVFADMCRAPGSNPRLLSPSGTITHQLLRAIGEPARGLVSTLTTSMPGALQRDSSVVLLDEAHRARTDLGRRRGEFSNLFERLFKHCAVLVLFLDERQIVRPGEGATVDELRRMADKFDYSFAEVHLRSQFRCGGSRSYLKWVDSLFSPFAQPSTWDGSHAPYDLAVANDPQSLENWTNEHVTQGRSARITAGFCWPWKSPDAPPLLSEVSIPWETSEGERRLWQRPWNARSANDSAGEGTPGRAFWSTDAGGHQQVGCVYTAQGMEYEYGAVILGEDITWTPQGWQARPEESEDPALRLLDPDSYLRYALNTYRVLATRGTRGTRLYSTDAATQRFLGSLAPTHEPR